MQKKGWILFLVLLCVAFLVSCGKKEHTEPEKGELVRVEALEEDFGLPFHEKYDFRRRKIYETIVKISEGI